MTLLDWIDDSRAHIFGRCGYWTQIEKAAEFNALVATSSRPHSSDTRTPCPAAAMG